MPDTSRISSSDMVPSTRDRRNAARGLIGADASRAKRKAVIDQHAAVFILQGALDRLMRLHDTDRGR